LKDIFSLTATGAVLWLIPTATMDNVKNLLIKNKSQLQIKVNVYIIR